MAFQHLRSSTANKRPLPGSMSDGQIAINTNTSSPGLFFKDSAGALVKVGPVHVGSTAPNVSPAGGGETGNTVGEQWLDTSGSTYVFKTWDGSAWRSEAGEFVNVTGDTMTGALGIIAGSASTPGLFFSGDANSGLYSPGADQVALSTGGSGRLFIDSNGHVGIGASSPLNTNYRFSVVGNRSNFAANSSALNLYLQYNTSTNGVFIGSPAADVLSFSDSGGFERMCLTTTGLGVGTSSPGSLLDIGSGSSAGVTQLTLKGGSTAGDYGIISIQNGSTQRGRIIADASTDHLRIDTAGGASTKIQFKTGAGYTDAVTIDASQRVGIGTSSPAALLHLSATAGNQELRFSDTTNSAMGRIYESNGLVIISETNHGISFQTNATVKGGFEAGGNFFIDTNTLYVDATNNRVGIGTTSANTRLHVGDYSGANSITIGSSPTTNGAILFADGAAGNDAYRGYFEYKHTNDVLVFGTAGSDKAAIDGQGRLLVGTSSARTNFFNTVAGTQLQVEGTTYQSSSLSLVATGNNSYDAGTLVLGKGRGNAVGSNTIVQNGTPPDILGYVSFQGNDGSEFVEGASIKAEVDGAVGANDLPSRLVFSTCGDGASSPTERMRIKSNGDVTVGHSDSSAPNPAGCSLFPNGVMHVGNNAGATGWGFLNFYRSTVFIGNISQNGTTGVSYNTSSDYRLKENVTPVTDGITRLQQLKPSRFNFIADSDRTVDGFIAHEVQTIVPEAITGEKDAVDDDGNPQYQGIDQSKLVPLLTAALQEAIGEIESLKARLTAAGI